MLCQNCGKYEATMRYTQIINGIKSEICLCENCAKKLGIGSIQFNTPMNLADFLTDFFDDYEKEMLPSFVREAAKCKSCGSTYEDFVQTGMLGCPDCYEAFSERIDPILRKLQGNVKHIGRGSKTTKAGDLKKSNKDESEVSKSKEDEKEKKANQKDIKLKELNEDLKKAIKDERYEDAANIRDEIKKLQNSKK